ncbi:MAG: hypothetical protein FJY95_05810 [Candidatus Handelsmanbacteria bacterium]|nr:hypothetical protein [Candidatus Handelsmanbacteria bacterium]
MRLSRLLLLLLLPACAHYSTSAGIAGGVRSIAIPVAQNNTPEAGIAEALTEKLSRAFTADGRLQVVDEVSADASLRLRLTAVEDRPFTYTAAEETQQYRFKLNLDAKLLKNPDGSPVLEAKGLTGWGTYDAGLSDAEGREEAVGAALDMVVVELVDRATSGW